MEIVRELISCACQSTWQQICQQLNYIRELEENDQTMRRELDSLRSKEKDISAKLNAGKVRHGKRPREEVTNWLKNLEEIESDVNSLGTGDARFWLNYYSRLKKSKKTVNILHRVRDLQARGNSFAQSEDIFMDSLPQLLSSLPGPPLYGSSIERKKDEILQCILDPEVTKIGVYGMGGVGKTSIMTQIYNQLKEMDVFEIVIWVSVSSSFDLMKLQDKIAESLVCDFPSSTEETRRAQRLLEAFKRRRNFVIILDDIWEGVSLPNVGIPEASNGSKIVWTTRLKTVCHSMESQREIEIKCLTDAEAWSLFKEKVGGQNIISPEIKQIAEDVARECRGLPLALITVGRALRKEYKLSVWRNALQQLKTSNTDQIKNLDKYVFGSLKFSYDRLSSDRIRACFLYCALYPEDYEIYVDKLIEYWMAEGLIDDEGSIQTEKDKGHAYLKELKDACMIESIEDGDEYVRMHDLIRDLAINITRKQFMVKAGLGLKESPKEEEWVESLERVSLMNNKIEAFQGQPNCPRLSTFLLHWEDDPRQRSTWWLGRCGICFISFISDAFFKHMHNLRVLDLSHISIKSLPNSVSDLVNLHALILDQCHCLQCLPSLAKLKKLRQLKLRGLKHLNKVPNGLENLVRLRHLDISHGGWGSFPSGALLKMSFLEILLMEGRRWRLSYQNKGDAEDKSTFEEIIRLKHLTSFSVEFADLLTFNSFINKADESELLKRLDFFSFTVRNKYDAHNVQNETMEKFRLPSNANLLGINGLNGVRLSDIFHWDDLRQLIRCKIEDCQEMEWIEKDEEIVFPSLKSLHLLDLDSFKGLCKGKAHEQTLKNLRQLVIACCRKLKYLIPIDLLVNNLENLEEISISDCEEIEHIISSEDASAAMTILPKLKKLRLWELPMLTSICQGKLVCDSLCEIIIADCSKLKRLPFLINKEPSRGTVIAGYKEWLETLEWEDPQSKALLQPFLYKIYDSNSHRMFRDESARELEKNPTIRIGKFELDKWGYPIGN